MKVNKQKVYFRLTNTSGFTSVSVVTHAKKGSTMQLPLMLPPPPPQKKK